MKDIEILLPDFEIDDLVEKQVIINEPQLVTADNELEIIPTNASWNRARHWLTTVCCATLSAWRKGLSRDTKDSLNRELQRQLRAFNYGVIKLKGFYQEVGQEADTENSYLTFDLHNDPDFFNNIRYLSESYNQDTFLYKDVNDELAYLIATNKNVDFVRKPAGRLKFGNMDAVMYSQIGAGRFSFE